MTEESIIVSLKDKEDSLKDKEESMTLEQLLKWRKISENEINKLTDQLDKLRVTITNINRNVWKKCDHRWSSVEGATDGDLCNKYCKTCNLFSISSLYR